MGEIKRMTSPFVFYDPTNSHLSNIFMFHDLNIEWHNNVEEFLKNNSPYKYFYIWESTIADNVNLIDQVPDHFKYNQIKIFLDICTGEIPVSAYKDMANKIKAYGPQHYVINVNSQFEFNEFNKLFEHNNKPLIFCSNRNEMLFAENLLTSKKPKRFLFLSRRFTIKRFLIFLDLHSRGILKNSHYTFSTYHNVYNGLDYSTKSENDIIFDMENNHHLHNCKDPYFLNLKQYMYDNKRTIFDELPKFVGKGFSNQDPYEIRNLFNESYISLLVESKLAESKHTYHPTEKLFKCFYYRHPFLVYSTPNFLHNTRLSGYKTFNMFDESYDDIEYWMHRVKAINDYVEYLNNMDELEFTNLHNKCLPVLNHNQNLLTSKIPNFYQNISYNKPNNHLEKLFKGTIKIEGFKE
jgi:hypothetical protein